MLKIYEWVIVNRCNVKLYEAPTIDKQNMWQVILPIYLSNYTHQN